MPSESPISFLDTVLLVGHGEWRHQIPFITMGALNGSHVRVGLEDSLYAGKGKLASSNAEQVKLIRSILDPLSFEIASPDEARAILALKGRDHVRF